MLRAASVPSAAAGGRLRRQRWAGALPAQVVQDAAGDLGLLGLHGEAAGLIPTQRGPKQRARGDQKEGERKWPTEQDGEEKAGPPHGEAYATNQLNPRSKMGGNRL